MEQVIEYIRDKYNPLSVILYGSYANGTMDSNSDFDALVISYDNEQYHDTSFVGQTQLDVFVYPAFYFEENVDLNDFAQILDGKIIIDTDGKGKELLSKVQSYFYNRQPKSRSENRASIDWCKKMLERTKRGDIEGMFRWHWVLTESLEIFCDIEQHPYLGPKKSLKWMEENRPAAYACYEEALNNLSIESLESWIFYISNIGK